MNYELIKRCAKETKCRVGDLLALAPQNDPFYQGAPAQQEKGEWFARVWRRFDMPYGTHIRRVHYRLVSEEPPVSMPSDKPYVNTENCWAFLGLAAKAARYLGLVDPGEFADQRNPDPILCADEFPLEQPGRIVADDAYLPEFDLPKEVHLPRAHGRKPGHHQRYMLEVWCEKTTMNDVLVPICRRFDANLVTGAGELSITSVFQSVERARSIGRPARIFYISDFDPAGKSMPVSAARKFEFLQDGMDLQLYPIALTKRQCKDYELPRTPIKHSERRRNRFEEIYGEGATELDALEAVQPGALAEIVTAALSAFYDDSIAVEAAAEGLRLSAIAAELTSAVTTDPDWHETVIVEAARDLLWMDMLSEISAYPLSESFASIAEDLADTLGIDLEAAAELLAPVCRDVFQRAAGRRS